jgi:adenylate kinase family enzyme
MIPDRIHITGASGTGTTSLARIVADKHGHRHFDSDDYYWLPTDPPYTEKRPADDRLSFLRADLSQASRWVLSGSLCGWGDPLIPQFELVVYLTAARDVRLSRLHAREVERYGRDAVGPGGGRHHAAQAFLEWAGLYDDGGLDVRSRALHEAWLSAIECRVLRLDGEVDLSEQLSSIELAYASAI